MAISRYPIVRSSAQLLGVMIRLGITKGMGRRQKVRNLLGPQKPPLGQVITHCELHAMFDMGVPPQGGGLVTTQVHC